MRRLRPFAPSSARKRSYLTILDAAKAFLADLPSQRRGTYERR
jgi:hypothetical protein